MNKHGLRVFSALALALGAALFLSCPAWADDPPQPEVPAVPQAVVAAPNAGALTEEAPEAETTAFVAGAASAPLAIAGEVGALSNQACYFTGSTPHCFANVQLALTDILGTGTLPSDRMIHLEDGTFPGFFLNGAMGNLSQLRGVIGLDGKVGTDQPRYITSTVLVTQTTKGFLLQGISVDGGDVLFNANSGTLTLNHVIVFDPGNRLQVADHYGAINTDKASVVNGEGATLDNSAHPSAGITVNNGVFGLNSLSGLHIRTHGVAKINGVDASRNNANGILVEAGKGVVITNAVTFDNTEWGVVIDNIGNATRVSIHTLQSHQNNEDGLWIITQGDITLTEVSADNNGGNGIRVGSRSSGTPGGRNLTGVDLGAYSNIRSGLELTLSGSLNLKRVSSGNNGLWGLYAGTGGAMMLDGLNIFNTHGTYALDLTNALASAKPGITISDKYGYNNVHHNQQYGARLLTQGAVSIRGLGSYNNVGHGIYIETLTSAGKVTLTDTGAWQNGVADDEYGVYVTAQSTITWMGGGAGGNGSYGARLTNTAASSGKTIRVENSGFNNNLGSSGLIITTRGAILLKNVSASENGAYGAELHNTLGAGNVSLLGNTDARQEFSSNGEAGVYITTQGAVTLSNITASNNGVVALVHGYGILVEGSATTPKAVSGINLEANSNHSDGIRIDVTGAITLANINANSNYLSGAVLYNRVSGAVKVLRTAPGSNTFNDNQVSTGLLIRARGAVTLGATQAINNLGNGVHISTCDSGACSNKWSVTLNPAAGSNFEFRNNWNGLWINSGGAVRLANIIANNNDGYGLYIWGIMTENPRNPVTISSVGNFTNTFSQNGSYGALVDVCGAISISNFNASENDSSGMFMNNSCPIQPGYKPAPVTLTNGDANGNGGDGVHAESLGTIKVNDVQASDNYMVNINTTDGVSFGERLESWNWSGGDTIYISSASDLIEIDVYLEFWANVLLDQWNGSSWVTMSTINNIKYAGYYYPGVTPGGYYRVVITGTNSAQHGDYLFVYGPQWEMSNAGANGFDLKNDYPGANGSVIVQGGKMHGNAYANNNSSTGVFITSTRAILTADLHASDNGGGGLHADNCLATFPSTCTRSAPITVGGKSTVFLNNYDENVGIFSSSTVKIQNIAAEDSRGAHGARITAGNLTITTNRKDWTNIFQNNDDRGLYISASGTIRLDKVLAFGNGDAGARINNTLNNTLAKSVLITNSSFNSNAGGASSLRGLYIYSYGAVTLRNVTANNNLHGGVRIENPGATYTSSTVTIQQCDFSANAGSAGIEIQTHANILWNSSSASNNSGGDGAELNTSGKVTVLASYSHNDFFNNYRGLVINGGSSIAIKDIRAGYNRWMGLAIFTEARSVSVYDGLIQNNANQGVLVHCNSACKLNLTSIRATHNAWETAGDYAAIDLWVDGGAITIKKSMVQGNGDWGILMDLQGGSYDMPEDINTYVGNSWDTDGSPNENRQIIY